MDDQNAVKTAYRALREAQQEQEKVAEIAQTDPEAARQRLQETQQAAAMRELAERELARRHLLPFICRLIPGYSAGWVHEDICRRLERFVQDVVDKKSPRLILCMPPRHGKSQIASICMPAWFLSKYPDMELIACSYNQKLAEKFSRQTKWILDDPEYQVLYPDIKRDSENDSIDTWGLAGHRGAYVAAGVGGGVTGKGAHILLIDDPIKDSEQADSDTVKEGIWDWYGSTAYTRLAPGGGVLVIQTLWADDDLAGRIMQQMKDDPESDQFEIVRYPALATEYEYQDSATHDLITSPQPLPEAELAERPSLILRRAVGAALHPDRYDEVALRRIKRTLLPRHWSALYQQNPVPDEGAYFKKADYKFAYPVPKHEKTNVYIAWDFAISEKNHNDYTVGAVGVQDYDDVIHAVDQVRFRSGDSLQIIESMIALLQKWYRPDTVVKMGVEDGQIWRAMQSMFLKRLKEKKLYHLAACLVLLRPLTDKMARARPLQGRMQQGMWVWPHDKPEWYETASHEMLRFPSGQHDDCVDAWAWVAQMAVGAHAPARPKASARKSWRDKLGKQGKPTGDPMLA